MRLADFQAAFAEGLRRGAMPEAVVAAAGAFAARLSIHVNHVSMSLREALALHFPVVRRLVGEDAFAALARRFLADRPPLDPRLALYGAEFPGFLVAEPALAALPVIADVARFEWARHCASLAPAATPAGLDGIDGASRLRLLPGAALLALDHAADHVWDVNQPGCDGIPSRLIDGPCRLAVWRDQAGFIRVAALDAADFAFLAAIEGGADLDAALGEALAAGGEIGPVIARAFGRGLLCHSSETTRTFP